MKKDIEVIGVESDLYPSLSNKMFNKKSRCKGSTLAEGIAVAEIGEIPFSILKVLLMMF